MTEFGTLVKLKRSSFGMSQKDFATLLGLKENGERTVRGWENGEHLPSPIDERDHNADGGYFRADRRVFRIVYNLPPFDNNGVYEQWYWIPLMSHMYVGFMNGLQSNPSAKDTGNDECFNAAVKGQLAIEEMFWGTDI